MGTIEIYSVAGRRVAELPLRLGGGGYGTAASGGGSARSQNSLTWDGRDMYGRQVSPGVYFCRLQAGQAAVTAKFVILR